MSKCIFFCVPAHGHVNAQLGLVDALVKKGEKVIYYCAPNFREKIEKTGAEFRPLETSADYLVETMGLTRGKNVVKIARMVVDVSNEVIEKIDKEVKKEKPDYIICDIITYFGMAAAENNNIPLITFLPVFCIDVKMFTALPAGFMAKMARQVLSVPGDDFAYISGLKKLKKYFKTGPVAVFKPFSRFSGLNIVSITRYFQHREELFPGNRFVFTGPMLFFGRENRDFPMEKLAGKKVIYISLGTVYHRNQGFFNECAKAFGGTDYAVVMSRPYELGTRNSEFGIERHDTKPDTRNPIPGMGNSEPGTSNPELEIPPNFIIRDYMPQLQILKYTDVFLTHGGMNSVQESLYFGVPMVIVPQAMDQFINGHRAAALGAGIFLNKANPKAAELRAAVEKMLYNPSYREKAKLAGDEARRAGGVEAAVRAIENFKRQNNIS